MTQSVQTDNDGVAYYLSLFDLDGMQDMFRSKVASWLDRNNIWLKGSVGDEYVLITGESEKQLTGRVDMLTESSFIGEVEVIERKNGVIDDNS